MESIKKFENYAIEQNQMFNVSGGKKTEGGSKMLDDVEMCYSSDRTGLFIKGTKYKDLKPCDCEC